MHILGVVQCVSTTMKGASIQANFALLQSQHVKRTMTVSPVRSHNSEPFVSAELLAFQKKCDSRIASINCIVCSVCDGSV